MDLFFNKKKMYSLKAKIKKFKIPYFDTKNSPETNFNYSQGKAIELFTIFVGVNILYLQQ